MINPTKVLERSSCSAAELPITPRPSRATTWISILRVSSAPQLGELCVALPWAPFIYTVLQEMINISPQTCSC